ncbi:hypothetical protein O1611_g298 [Lasiodiplodia mahajangana]|uniref:Uncharacterized protein n=1 Tax=Lasiodiplodia mahajangana TaxID=1108764 RepID=A0ACC2K0Z1_9PEZI|nr:hypothetical protein O1611_g298 [Lasiodiplodia mahajangana]
MNDEDLTSLKHQPEAEISSELGKNESQDILDVITDCIQALLRISILIRKVTPRDRFARALQSGNSFMDQFDINYVAQRYNKLDKTGSEWLCERLGRAITKRRQFIWYSREHSGRLIGMSGNYKERRPYVLSNDGDEGMSFDITLGTQVRSSVGTKLSGSIAPPTQASTKASTIDIAMLQQIREDEVNKEDTGSLISASSFLQSESEDSRLHLPSLEEMKKGNSVFECPFCRGLQTFTQESAWRRHAYRDLKAYVCTLGDERCDAEMFEDSRTWFSHELQNHRKQWMCILCSKGRFGRTAEFKSHIKDKHSDVSVDDNQLNTFMKAGQCIVDAIAADQCPFCDEWEATLKNSTPIPPSVSPLEAVITVEPAQFRRHVASHMEQLASFAIPRSMGDDGSEDGSGKGVALSRSTVNAELQMSMPELPNTGDEWISDPPLHIAAASGDLAMFRYLLEEGDDIYLRGETWGTVVDAALSCPSSTRDDILDLLRNHNEASLLPNIPPRTEVPNVGATSRERPVNSREEVDAWSFWGAAKRTNRALPTGKPTWTTWDMQSGRRK